MDTLYIDYTNGTLSNKKNKYHAGGDFSRNILIALENYNNKFERRKRILVLWPKTIIC